MTRNEGDYVTDCSLYLRSVTVEDAGKYKVTARNDLGESNATISLNFDSKFHLYFRGAVAQLVERPSKGPWSRCNSTDVGSNRKRDMSYLNLSHAKA